MRDSMKKRIASVISGVAIAAMLLMSACSPAKPADDITIRVALLPVLDVLPIVVV